MISWDIRSIPWLIPTRTPGQALAEGVAAGAQISSARTQRSLRERQFLADQKLNPWKMLELQTRMARNEAQRANWITKQQIDQLKADEDIKSASIVSKWMADNPTIEKRQTTPLPSGLTPEYSRMLNGTVTTERLGVTGAGLTEAQNNALAVDLEYQKTQSKIAAKLQAETGMDVYARDQAGNPVNNKYGLAVIDQTKLSLANAKSEQAKHAAALTLAREKSDITKEREIEVAKEKVALTKKEAVDKATQILDRATLASFIREIDSIEHDPTVITNEKLKRLRIQHVMEKYGVPKEFRKPGAGLEVDKEKPAIRPAQGGYKIGAIYGGNLKYLGGDPKNSSSFEKVK